jgi:Icc protein
MNNIISWVHFGDLHIAGWQDQNYTEFLYLVGEANNYLASSVEFALLPGDNADDAEEDQYQLVRRAVAQCHLSVHAIPGDHDCASGDLNRFEQYLSALPYRSFTKGSHHFALLNSVAQWHPPQFGLGPEQIAWLERDLTAAHADGLHSILFMHAYPSEHREVDRISSLIRRRRVLVVDMGHTHYNELANDGHTIYAATRSTGQIEEGPPGFSIITVDHSAVSWKFKPIGEWPQVMITSPCDHRLIIDPACPQQIVSGPVPIRARAWGDEIVAVRLRIDHEEPTTMIPLGEAIWSGAWDSARGSDGLHSVHVEAQDQTGRIATDAISAFVSQSRHFVPPERRAVDFENALGAWPEKHILGTQLGPNRHGRYWPSKSERNAAMTKGSR